MGRTEVAAANTGVHVAPPQAASAAGLRYVTDDAPGIRRVRRGKSFAYVRPDDRPLRDRQDLARIRSLVIPPAWTDVWICTSPKGHLQAVGRDARGRKQYRYHPRWRESRDEAKYGRMVAFGKTLPKIRARVEDDLARPALPREKVLAAVVRLLERTLIRVGNQEYARANRSFGLTTLRSHHVDVAGGRMRFQFRGKSGKQHEIGIQDLELSRIVRRCQELPGQELFQYLDERGHRRSVKSEDVNRYLRAVCGQPFTAKDFRTWGGTVRAAFALAACEPVSALARARQNVARAIEEVSRRLGNTPSICRKCYVHPAVVESYMDGVLAAALGRRRKPSRRAVAGLSPHESAVLRLLEKRLARGPVSADDRLRRELKASLTAARRQNRAPRAAHRPRA
ncbi:MAG TPA: DNA topoisomerase IB [Vicinamibacteria bacterium]